MQAFLQQERMVLKEKVAKVAVVVILLVEKEDGLLLAQNQHQSQLQNQLQNQLQSQLQSRLQSQIISTGSSKEFSDQLKTKEVAVLAGHFQQMAQWRVTIKSKQELNCPCLKSS